MVVSNIVNDHYNNIHQAQITDALARSPLEHLLPKYLPRQGEPDRRELSHRVGEMFLRERMAGSLGLQPLDVFVARILQTVFLQGHELPPEKLRILLNHDPTRDGHAHLPGQGIHRGRDSPGGQGVQPGPASPPWGCPCPRGSS